MAGDWLKLYRDAMDHPVFCDSNHFLWKLFSWCIMSANYEPSVWKGHQLSAGEFVTGRITASQQLGVSPSAWVRGIEVLKDMGCITTRANSSCTVVSVCNWACYQSTETDDRTAEDTADDTTTGQRAIQRPDTDKEIKKLRKKERNTGARAVRFIKPTLEEVGQYCSERANGIDPQSFVDHYESNGWVIGRNKTPMKNWQAAVRTWETHRKSAPATSSKIPEPGSKELLEWRP